MNPHSRSLLRNLVVVTTLLAFTVIAASDASQSDAATSKAKTLDDLKKLEITCFVPSYLPKGFKLKKVEITQEDVGQDESGKRLTVPDYAIEWGDGKRSFSIESAAEGVGDRNLMEEEDSEETELKTALGPIYIIYRPKGKEGNKVEILTNWYEDAEMKKETAKGTEFHPGPARFHGFTGAGISVAEFQKILDSLHPVKSDGKGSSGPAKSEPPLKIHPKVFNLIQCWISDSESPVVTEINLDAVDNNGNEFNDDDLKPDGEWTRARTPDQDGGFMRYRVVESKGNHYKVEYQENGGGSLTTTSTIEFDITKRSIQREGKPVSIRVLRVTSYADER